MKFLMFFNNIQYIEYAIISSIITYQIYLFIKIWIEINGFKKIFKDPLLVKKGKIDKEIVMANDNQDPNDLIGKIVYDDMYLDENHSYYKIAISETISKNKTLKIVSSSLNGYLIKNIGAEADFSIIRDIVEREIKANDEEINQSIPAPLYIGLAATMIGIIIGLFGMNSGIDSGEIKGFDVTPIINGVKIAMAASLTGLITTSILSTLLYRKAKSKVLVDTNHLLSELQTELLPVLTSGVDLGIKGLNKSLSEFNRNAHDIVFAAREATEISAKNIIQQNNLLDKIKNTELAKVTKYNTQVFKLMEKNIASFEEISMFFSDLGEISKNLKLFANRTNNIEIISSQIMENSYNSNELMKFLSGNFKELERIRELSETAINGVHSSFKDNLNKLEQEIEKRIEKLNEHSGRLDSEFRETFEIINEKIKTTAKEHIDEFKIAYSNAVPNFSNLDYLPEINTSIDNEINSINSISTKLDRDDSIDKLISVIKAQNKLLSDKIEDVSKRTYSSGNNKMIENSGSNTNKISVFDKVEQIFKIVTYGAILGVITYFIFKM